jgi:catechol 2,3-dioxygenase-like lactoylglutathione lyase family enzyme
MNIRVDHTGLVVSDIEQGIRFYTETFGFEIDRRLAFSDRELVVLALGEEPAAKIELLRYDATDVGQGVSRDRSRLGWNHIAFRVSDVAGLYQSLLEKGVEMLENPPFQQENGPPIAFGRDPEGNLLEFTEI